jgi:hypothetical protein
LPNLIDKLFGPVPALIAAGILLFAGIACLVAAHLDKGKEGARRRLGLMETVAIFTLIGACSGALVGSISGAIWKLAHNNRSASQEGAKQAIENRSPASALPATVEELKSTRRSGLIGELESACVALIGGEVWALFKIRIINQEAPSAADGWSVVAITKSGRYTGSLKEITRPQNIPGQYETIKPTDSIYHKAMSAPIPTGGNVWGWLAVGFGSVDYQTITDARWEISFTDSLRERHFVTVLPMSQRTRRTSQ